MNSFSVVMAFALAVIVAAEAPGYNYNRGGGSVSSGASFNTGSSFSSGSSFSTGGSVSGGGQYQVVNSGFQTNEGQNVDPQLLNQVKQILLQEEAKSGGGGGGQNFGGGAPSSSYGVPSGASGRVVGIDLEGVRQAIEVVQLLQSSSSGGGGSGGFSSSFGSSASGGSAGYSSGPSRQYGAP